MASQRGPIRTATGGNRALQPFRAAFADFVVTGDLQPTELPAPRLGDESVPGLELAGASNPARGTIYLWRVRNVVVLVVAFYLDPELAASDVLRIAKQVDFRAAS